MDLVVFVYMKTKWRNESVVLMVRYWCDCMRRFVSGFLLCCVLFLLLFFCCSGERAGNKRVALHWSRPGRIEVVWVRQMSAAF